jgi:hypothetical protein
VTAPSAPPAGLVQPEALRHPHAAFNMLVPIVAQLLAQGRDALRVLGAMSAYVSALQLDDWFDTEWKKLVHDAKNVSRTGLTGLSPTQYQLQQYHLILRGARRYHLLETEATPASAQSWDEKLERIKGGAARAQR